MLKCGKKEKKKELFKHLEELSNLKDKSVAHAEADEILINFNILNISSVRADAVEFTELLIECAKSVKDALENFENFKKGELVKEKAIAINVLEEKADKMFENAMKKLYKEETNPIEIIKWTTIYNCLENTTDACERIADSLEDVVMKNS